MSQMTAWIEPLGWMLVHSVWLISLIVAVAAVTLSLLRRRSANARYLVGGVALVLSVSVLPSVFVWVMAQSREVARPVVAIDTTAADKATDAIEWGGAGQHFRVDADPDFTPQPVASHLQSTTDDGSQSSHTEVTMRDESTTRSAVEEPTTWQQIEARLRPHLAWLVGGWLVGVCLLSLRPLIGWHATWRLRRVGLSEVPDSVLATLHRLAERLGLRRATKVFQSSLVRIPCVVGAFKPVILLPASVLVGLSPEQLEALLAHELAHIRRHDFAVNVVQTLAETLLFYHPAIWWLSRRIRQEREHCCDDLAISVCGDVAGYARMLVSVEGLRARVPQTSVAASGGSLVERIRRLLPSPEQTRSPWITGIVVLATLMVLVGSWQLTVGQVSNLPEKDSDDVGRALLPVESATTEKETGKSARPTVKDWPQWGRTSQRNNVAEGRLPLDWNLEKGTNIVWQAKLGDQTYSSPIVSGGKVFIGTNNASGLNPAHPKEKDLSCLVCFDEATGKLLWQYASEKLPAGRSFDWPQIGLCSTAFADGDRVWVVTNRCEVVCLDANGFRDGENDGPFRDEPAQTEIDADVIWKFDMFGELGVRPLHQAASSITMVDGVLLLNTSNGPDESYQKVAAPHAPNFLALDATSGRVIWKDNSAGESIVVGGSTCMCSGASPAVATLGGVTQAIFTGKEGWVYGYDFNDLKLGKTTLLWKFDCNPKTGHYLLGSKSRRHPLVASPIVADGRVYVATGRNPEHGEGEADLWCIDPTKRGDISAELVFNKSFENGEQPIPHKPLRACEIDKGDFVRPNPNSGAIWHYAKADRNGDGKIEFDETFHCTMGSPVIHDGLLFIADFSGMMHCLDAKTGEVQWTHDLLSAVWGTCVVADGHVLIGDEDGDLEILKVSRTKQSVFGDTPPNFSQSVYATPALVQGTLFVASKSALVAIRDPKQSEALNAATAPQAIPEGLFKPLECELVDAVTGEPIPENSRDVTVLRQKAAVDDQGKTKLNVTKLTLPHTLVVTGFFRFIKPKSGDDAEKIITARPYVSKSSHRITVMVPDEIMRRADRDELLLEWRLGDAPVYKNYEPIERIPLKRLLSNDPKTGRDSFRTIKLTPKPKAAALGAGLPTPPDQPTEGLPNVARPTTNSTDSNADTNEETFGRIQRRGQETRAERGLTATSWASFRHDLAQTGVASSPLPDKLEPLWETNLGNQVVGTAAIVGDHVYVPCLSGELFSLDRKSGRKLWAYQSVSDVKPNSFRPGFQASPTVSAEAIYLGDEDGVFHAIDRTTGKARWTFKTDGEIFSSAAVVNGKVLFGSYDSHLYCLNESDGTLAWKFATQGKVHCAPAVIDGLVLIAGCDEHLRVIDIATGAEKKDIPLGSYLIASPAIVGNLAFVGTYGSEVLAVNRTSGEIAWRYSAGKGDFPFHSSAAVTDKLVVLGGHDKFVHGIDRTTGQGLWKFATRGKVESSPVIVGQRVFIGSDDGNLYELEATTGTLRASFHLGKPISASPAIGEGMLVIGSKSNDGRVVCYGGPALGAGLPTPPNKPTEGLPNDARPKSSSSTTANKETSGPTERRGQETRAEHDSQSRLIVEWSAVVDDDIVQSIRQLKPVGAKPQLAPQSGLVRCSADELRSVVRQRLAETKKIVPGTYANFVLPTPPGFRTKRNAWASGGDVFEDGRDEFRGQLMVYGTRSFEDQDNVAKLQLDIHNRFSGRGVGDFEVGLQFNDSLNNGEAIALTVSSKNNAEAKAAIVCVYESLVVPAREVEWMRRLSRCDDWIRLGPAGMKQRIERAINWRSRATQDVRAIDPKWTRDLPNGGHVQLVAISRPAQAPLVWWTPDGQPISGLDPKSHLPLWTPDLWVLVRVWEEGARRDYLNVTTAGEWKNGVQELPIDETTAGSQLVIVPAALLKREGRSLIKIGTGFGPWTAETRLDATKGATATLGKLTVKMEDVYEADVISGVNLSASRTLNRFHWTPLDDVDVTILAVRQKGRLTPEANPLVVVNEAPKRSTEFEHAVSKEAIEHFIVKTRPRSWAEFTGFATEPAEPLNPPLEFDNDVGHPDRKP